VARSPDLAAWTGVLILSFMLPTAVSSIADALVSMVSVLPQITANPDISIAMEVIGTSLRATVAAVVPLFAVIVATGILMSVAQGGSRPHLARLRLRGSRINPATAAKRMVGPQGMWELAKQLIKTAVIGFVVWRLLLTCASLVSQSGSLTLSSVAATIAETLLRMLRTVAFAGLLIGVADYMIARRRVGKELMMSRKEVQDEHRQSEGDPQSKATMRQRARAAMRNRMMADVPSADFVLVNPTHVAVALRYQAGLGAPRVIAKGQGFVAQRIKAVASENRVTIIEDIPLARALFSSCDIGQEIPRDLYTAVARILAFVMALRVRGVAAGTHRTSEVAAAAARQ